MSETRPLVVFSGGGTGGHLYPALALAAALREVRPDVDVHFMGARRGLEARVLAERSLPHDLLEVEGLPRSGGIAKRLRALVRLARGVGAARRRLAALEADLVVVTGGYAGLPAGLAARFGGITLALQEQNAVPGLTTRLLAANAQQVHLAYPEAGALLPQAAHDRVWTSGNPVTPPSDIPGNEARQTFALDAQRPVVLVVGGSQGSAALNRGVLEWLAERNGAPVVEVDGRVIEVQLLWSTGPTHFEAVRERLGAAPSSDVHCVGYIDDMPRALAAADLAVSRAGAMATSEFLAWGLPSVLVPLPTAAADHQTSNARALAEAGAARHLPESEWNGRSLERTLAELLARPETLESYREAAWQRGRPEAARDIGRALAQLLPSPIRQPDAAPPRPADARLDALAAALREGPVHFMGIGGAGMNALAEWLLREGTEVSGCDSRESDTIAHLRALGATIDIGHDPAHIDAAGALVVTAAVPPDHPELQRARERGIAVAKRAEALGAVVHPHRVVAIAGTHGKTSTSALTVHVLAEAGLDPTGFVGGHVAAWQGNLRRGASDLVVVEADEYDRSFHQLRPEVAVVTNLEADHLDIYGDLAGVHEAFRVFAEGLVPGGALIVCADDVGACSVLGAHPAATTYGLSAGSELRAVEVEADSTGQRFRIIERGHDRGRAELPRHGVHALRNALAAAAVARRFGVAWPVIFEAWRSHRGVQRRFELHGTPGGVTVIDDYAHHPEEIRATIRAVRDGWPGHTLRAAFQPHLYSRTRDFADDFGAALAGADEVWLTALYPAREAPIPGVSEELVASAAERHGAAVRRHESLATLPEALVAACEPGDVLLCMGAGSIGEVAPKVAQQLRDRESVEQRPSAGSSAGSAAGSSEGSATSTEVDA